ncbi:MAG: VCBS repeat-containing protein [Bacteroidetes bacterium]|nr:VCBS repeat-containing protein [Bacteroidota bacterium]
MVKTTFHKSLVLASACLLGAISANAQFSFTNSNSLISNLTRSGCAISVVDINNDGLDDIVKMDQSDVLVIDLQNANGTFTNYDLGTITGGTNVWGMALADVDHNGWKDVATGVNGTMYLVKLFWSGSTITKTQTTLSGSYFVQNITFGDIDNDGWVDLAVCDDNDYMKVYKNNAGTMSLTTSLINTEINPGMTYSGDPYDSGNYGSVWLDFDNDGDLDLYIAHCRQSASSSSDQRRRDRLFVNNGSNVYTEQAATYGIEVSNFKQTWTTSFGDLDNDGDFDIVMTNHGENGQILKNDGSGHFTDVTASTGWVTSIDPIESVVEDFDNDGYLDIMISGSQWYMWHNNGDMTFTPVTGVLPNLGGLLSFATGDLNHDGFIDLQTSYGNIYNSPSTVDDDVLYLNNKNGNHYITFNLTGTASNHDAIGARVTITGSFGTQIREVRAGETYGTANSMQLHFGLGSATTITSAVIDWPAGGTTTLGPLSADQFVTVVESGCTITGNVIPGPYAFCTAGSVTLTAPAGYTSYLWSNGATTSSIVVSTTGTYNVKVTNAAGCTNISPNVTTVLNPNETPTVTSSGANSCAGTLTLTSTPASAYSWTGPSGFTATTQAINPTTSGTYSLTTTGLCQNWTSAPTVVSVLAAPSPTGTGAAGPGPASFNISAAGSGGTLNWYTASTGGAPLATGASYTTPTISTTTTYYVDETTNYPGTLNNGGRTNGSGSTTSTVNGGLDFDVLAPCTLVSVKVYATTTGPRTIQLRDNTGTILNTMTTGSLPIDSSVVTLNFPLTPGVAYRLTQPSTPSLKRNTVGVTYPYTTAGLVNITNGWTGSATSSSAYYYYYDWKIQTPNLDCTSPRVPVTATVTTLTGINALSANNGVAIYPNPASTFVNVEFGYNMNSLTVVEVTDVTGRLVKTHSISNPSQGQIVSVDVADLNAGSYFITIKNDTQKLVQKLVLTK